MNTGLILYMRPSCPFSAKVLLEAAVLGVDLVERDIKDPEAMAELMEKGGKNQTPFLVDTGNDTMLYESDAIMTYLHERFGQNP